MKVLFIDTVHSILNERLELNGFSCIDGTTMNLDELIETVRYVDGIVIRSKITLDETFLKHANQLKFIARSGAGMENIDVTYCSKRGIELFNAPEGNRNAVGEHALGMLLALLNKIPKANAEVRRGKWDREGNRGIEIEGKTIGIIGFGNNGSAFAKVLSGFDAKIIAYDKYKSGFQNEFVDEVTIEEVFQSSDIVSFHIPQNEETIYYANDSFFNAFNKPIYLINLSRGKIVETKALVKAMQKKQVLGACLDVLEYEKASFENFFDQNLTADFQYILNAENVILTPHVGGWTTESYIKLSNVLADKILARFNTK